MNRKINIKEDLQNIKAKQTASETANPVGKTYSHIDIENDNKEAVELLKAEKE